jgi:hypothetical protein
MQGWGPSWEISLLNTSSVLTQSSGEPRRIGKPDSVRSRRAHKPTSAAYLSDPLISRTQTSQRYQGRSALSPKAPAEIVANRSASPPDCVALF